MRSLDSLIEAARREAAREAFPVDEPVYREVGRDPGVPILCAGSLDAPVCVVGRDLGRNEVAAAQPLIGAGGRLVRAGFYQAAQGTPPPATDDWLESVLERVLLTNTVPFKPPGNKAYSAGVKERFRPFLAELLVDHWKGRRVITLGNEAFLWFERYAPDPQRFDEFWSGEDRYTSEIEVVASFPSENGLHQKSLLLLPLPHPSPLNARWYKKFPELLARRLKV